MNIQKQYQAKLTTAEEAVKVVKSGDWVDYTWGVCTPDALDRALAARAGELFDVKVRGGIIMKEPEIFKVDNVTEHFSWNSWHMTGIERKAIAKGFALGTSAATESTTMISTANLMLQCFRLHQWTHRGISASVLKLHTSRQYATQPGQLLLR